MGQGVGLAFCLSGALYLAVCRRLNAENRPPPAPAGHATHTADGQRPPSYPGAFWGIVEVLPPPPEPLAPLAVCLFGVSRARISTGHMCLFRASASLRLFRCVSFLCLLAVFKPVKSKRNA